MLTREQKEKIEKAHRLLMKEFNIDPNVPIVAECDKPGWPFPETLALADRLMKKHRPELYRQLEERRKQQAKQVLRSDRGKGARK